MSTITNNIYNYLVSNTKLKDLNDIIKYRSEYRPLTLGLIKSTLNKLGISYDNNIVYNLLDDVSRLYVSND